VEEVPLVRAGSFADLTREMNGAIQIAGMPNWFLMPIQTRMGMVTTGMRGELGLKVYGTDYGRVERLAVQLEQVLRNEVPNTISAVADRLAEGGTYLDVEIDREACARYGLRVEDVQEVVRTAIGGMEVTRTVEGRYRFPVVVRYPRELRDDPERLRRVSIPRPGGGAPVTLGQVARIRIVPGPMAIRSEDNRLVIYLPVAFEGVTPGEYVRQAKRAIERAVADGRVEVSPGYGWRWSGQYEMMEETNRRLWMLGALALALIFLVLYLYFQRVVPVVVVMVATLLFAPVGGAWLMWLMGFDLSTAVWVGFIAEMGLAAETAVIMFVYLDNARKDRERRFGRLTPELLDEAIEEGATLRVRPKMMTVLTDLFGVLPMFWATGAGAATLSRMAAPLAGGIVSSMILTLVVIPAVYKLMYLPQTKKAVIPEGGAM
jgi:Cu(I)/Ag(I) efflux system membrane protein CusA/SilA